SPVIFDLLGIQPALGRLFSPEEEQPGAPKVVILTNAFWQSRCGSDPRILGKTLLLDDDKYTVIGILPAEFQFPLFRADVWVPLGLEVRQNLRGNRFLRVLGRLREGTTVAQAQAQLGLVARKLEEQYPATNTGMGIQLVLLQDQLVRQ